MGEGAELPRARALTVGGPRRWLDAAEPASRPVRRLAPLQSRACSNSISLRIPSSADCSRSAWLLRRATQGAILASRSAHMAKISRSYPGLSESMILVRVTFVSPVVASVCRVCPRVARLVLIGNRPLWRFGQGFGHRVKQLSLSYGAGSEPLAATRHFGRCNIDEREIYAVTVCFNRIWQ